MTIGDEGLQRGCLAAFSLLAFSDRVAAIDKALPNPLLRFHIHSGKIQTLPFFLYPDNHSFSFNNSCRLRVNGSLCWIVVKSPMPAITILHTSAHCCTGHFTNRI